ncbi:hypothetical protein BDW62DRAFT_218861 [Aspergillus aurantiobrunneus]
MAMRLPGCVDSASKFWELLVNKRDAVGPVPAERYREHNKAGRLSGSQGYFLHDQDLAQIDAGFFSMSRAELEQLDPHHRLLLEVVYEALESAGETNWRGRDIGCYVGYSAEDWNDLQAKDPQDFPMYRVTGSFDFALANRISYEYDLRGPSFVIKAACASSMMALHLACEAVSQGQCSSAVVSGANLLLGHAMTTALYEAGALSADVSCKTFDASADGYARADAGNAVYIKRLDDALRDGNPIRAVIRSSASNFDGKTLGISNPSTPAQEALIRKAYKLAGLDAAETAFCECHGTGTAVGDPTEATAVGNVWRDSGIMIGSVKPNVGHSEAASGLTSVIKAVLCLENRTIAPNIKFKTPHPKIPWESAGLLVPTEATPWPVGRNERISVNNFGFGGSNCHVEQFYSLERPLLEDLAYTLGARRQHLPYRAFAVTDGSGSFEVTTKDRKASNGSVAPVFVFTGQGAQWAGMGKELLFRYISLMQDIRSMDMALSLLELPPAWRIEGNSLLDQAEYSQPICTALQIALVNLLRLWGVNPSAVIGHSSGEVAAAYAVGSLTMEEAITVAYYRGVALKAQKRRGGMAAVGMGAEDVLPLLPTGVSIACVNSSRSVTISGDEEPLETFIQEVKQTRPEVFVRRLRVEMAYHSGHMKDIGPLYRGLLEGRITPKPPAVPLFSTTKNQVIEDASQLGPSYWVANLEQPVLFYTGVKALMADPRAKGHTHLEIGPHGALAGPLKQIYKEVNAEQEYVALQNRYGDAQQNVLKAMGQLFCTGVHVDFAAMNPSGVTLSNLPHYPWHRQGTYWHESRVMKAWRMQQFPHHDLLGSRVAEASAVEPVWRNLFHLDNLPWMQDHVIRTDIAFPPGAYIAMAGAAVIQVSGSSDYTVRNVTIESINALQVQLGDTVELVTSLRPSKLTDTMDSDWYEFSIVSATAAGWVKHCHGLVRPGLASRYTTGGIPLFPRCVPSARWYKAWRRFGLDYGPSYRGLHEMSFATGQKAMAATVLDRPTVSESPYPLHPTSITLVLQSLVAATHNGQVRALNHLHQPTYIEELYVGIGTGKETRFLMEAQTPGSSLIAGGGYGVDATGAVTFYLKGATLSMLSDGDGIDCLGDPHGAVQLEWRPYIDFLDPGTLIKPGEDMTSVIAMIERLCLLCAVENAQHLEGITASEVHLQKYRHWLQEFVGDAKAGKGTVLSATAELCAMDSTARQALIDQLMDEAKGTPSFAAYRTIHTVYESMADILAGKTDALEVLFRDNMLTEFYNFFNWVSYRDFMELLGHANPNLRVLEIGAGTGGTTESVIKHLARAPGKRFYSKYVFTDISAGFFVNARERFAEYAGIHYQTLDITNSPAEQGFEEGSFDLVIASNVLHATPKLANTLRNVRKLLRPRGRLLLCELSPATKFVDYIMGLLPGWWLGEHDGRPKKPYVSPERWDEELRRSGFDGIESVCFDQEPPYLQNATMLARATETTPRPPASRVTILGPANGPIPSARALEEYLQREGVEVDVCSLDTVPPPHQDIISVYELEAPFFHEIGEQDFRDFVRFISTIGDRRLLWLTRPAQMSAADPRYSLVVGLARTVRSELNIAFGVLELDALDECAWEATRKVLEKLRIGADEGEETDQDYEFALSNQMIHVSRLAGLSVTGEVAGIGVQGEQRHLQIGKKGVLESLRWSASTEDAPLGPNEVEVDVRVAGMNYRDVFVAMGIVEGDDFGYECAGVVHKVGGDVHDLKAGDSVMVLSEQSLCSRLRASSHSCIKMPATLTFEEAATMPSIYATVIRGLLDIGRLAKGQTVLVQAAAGAAGMAAMYICNAVGAYVYATTDAPAKAAFLTEKFGLPASRIFSCADESFVVDVMAATQSRGVDLVLNSLTGEMLHASWQCVAEGGVMVELGKHDLVGHGKLALDLFQGNRGFFGVDVARLCRNSRGEARSLLEKIVSLYEAGQIKPLGPIVTIDGENIVEAFRFMQQRKHTGKVAIRMPDHPDGLPGMAVPGQRKLFRPDVSYLLVGGLGGLGQAVATWMVERGARHLIFFSRSAASGDAHGPFFDELDASGCSVQVMSGDVSSVNDVKRAVASANRPIAGVLQMSLVLRDRSLPEMSMEEWNEVLAPKVQGTWNLHEALGNHLDFFIMFSSLCGLAGQWGQANYAAANTFLDAFAQYRQSQGLACSVLDIGVMEDVGSLTRNPAALEPLRASAYWMLTERDLLESLELMVLRSSSTAGIPIGARQAWTNPHQVGLGFRSTLPLSDPRNRVVWRRDRRMAAFRNDDELDDGGIETSASTNSLSQFLSSVANNPAMLDSSDGVEALGHEIGSHLKEIFQRASGDLNLRQAFSDLGVDSLIMIELRNWLRHRMGIEITPGEMLEAGSVLQVAGLVAQRLKGKYDA